MSEYYIKEYHWRSKYAVSEDAKEYFKNFVFALKEFAWMIFLGENKANKQIEKVMNKQANVEKKRSNREHTAEKKLNESIVWNYKYINKEDKEVSEDSVTTADSPRNIILKVFQNNPQIVHVFLPDPRIKYESYMGSRREGEKFAIFNRSMHYASLHSTNGKVLF